MGDYPRAPEGARGHGAPGRPPPVALGAAAWGPFAIGAACAAVLHAAVSVLPPDVWRPGDLRVSAGIVFAVLGAADGIWLGLRPEKTVHSVVGALAGFLAPAALTPLLAFTLAPPAAGELTADLWLFPAAAGVALSLCVCDPRPKDMLLAVWRGALLSSIGLGVALPLALLAISRTKSEPALTPWAIVPAAFGLGNTIFLLSLWRHARRKSADKALGRMLDKMRRKH